MDADDILLDFPTGTVVTPELVARRIAALSGATVLPNAGGPIGPEEPRLVYAEEAELARLRSENAAYYAKSFADAGAIADLTAEVSRLSGEVERLTGELAATDEMLGDAVKLCLSAKRERDEARGSGRPDASRRGPAGLDRGARSRKHLPAGRLAVQPGQPVIAIRHRRSSRGLPFSGRRHDGRGLTDASLGGRTPRAPTGGRGRRGPRPPASRLRCDPGAPRPRRGPRSAWSGRRTRRAGRRSRSRAAPCGARRASVSWWTI
jgi:hypothetical protein